MKSRIDITDVPRSPARNPPILRTEARKGVWLVWMFATFWNMTTFPFASSMLAHIPAFGPIWVVLMFPLFGVVLLIWAFHLSWRLMRFGEYSLALHPTDASLGTCFDGKITLEKTLPTNPAFIVALVCDQVYLSDGEAHPKRIWQQEQQVSLLGRTLAFSFSPPKNLPASEPKISRYYRWLIRMQSLDNQHIEASFDITLNSAHAYAPTMVVGTKQPLSATAFVVPANIAMLQRTSDGLEIDYPPQRQQAPIALVAGGVFTLPAAWLLPTTNEPLEWIIAIWFGLIGLGIIALGIHALTYRLCVTIQQEQGESNSHWLFGNTHDSFLRKEVQRLVPVLTSNREGQDSYKIEALLTDGRRVELGHSIPNSLVTQAIMQRIATALDLDNSLLAPIEYAAANVHEK